MSKLPLRSMDEHPPGLLFLLLTQGFDAALTSVCTFSVFSVLSPA